MPYGSCSPEAFCRIHSQEVRPPASYTRGGLLDSCSGLRLEPRAALAFTTVTGVIFSAAVGLTLGLTSLRLDTPLIAVPWEGIISGALAAWLFHRASALFLALQTTTRAVSVVTLGALGAGALTQLMSNPGASEMALVLASAACAAGVGYSSFRVLARSTRLDESSYAARLGSLLHSEAVQTLGIIYESAEMVID